MAHKDNLMVWLLAIYGVVGALYPVLIVADHVGTNALRWLPSVTYPLIWVIFLISFGALALAGITSASRTKQNHRVHAGLPGPGLSTTAE
jgi:hypothetical protein